MRKASVRYKLDPTRLHHATHPSIGHPVDCDDYSKERVEPEQVSQCFPARGNCICTLRGIRVKRTEFRLKKTQDDSKITLVKNFPTMLRVYQGNSEVVLIIEPNDNSWILHISIVLVCMSPDPSLVVHGGAFGRRKHNNCPRRV